LRNSAFHCAATEMRLGVTCRADTAMAAAACSLPNCDAPPPPPSSRMSSASSSCLERFRNTSSKVDSPSE
jgi:hypothetical protein